MLHYKVYSNIYIKGVQEKKLFFFTIHCNPSLAYIADLQSSQRNAIVQSLLLAGDFLYNR